jgi:hypothetical protein
VRDVAATRRTLLAVLESLAQDEAGAAASPLPEGATSDPAARARRARGKR